MDEIGSRYFVLNGFDGILTVLGVTIGSYLTGTAASNVLIGGFGAATGLFFSGLSAAYITERAQRLKELNEVEEHMKADLSGTKKEKEVKESIKKTSMINGFSPLLFSTIVLLPFIIGQITSFTLYYELSFIISLISLALLGAYLPEDRRLKMKSAFWMILAGIGVGIVTALISNI